MQDYVTIALAKGRLAEETFRLLENMGVDCRLLNAPIFFLKSPNLDFFLITQKNRIIHIARSQSLS